MRRLGVCSKYKVVTMSENDKYRGTGEYFLVFNELANAARYRGTVTYQELCHLIGLPVQGSYMGMELGKILGAISEDQVKLGRPMLSAVAVGVSGEPGAGFFGLAKDLNRFTGGSAQERSFWESERDAVYKSWSKKF